MNPIGVFALGSPFGIDRLGWSIVETLEARDEAMRARHLRLHCVAGCEQMLGYWNRTTQSEVWIIDTLVDTATDQMQIRQLEARALTQQKGTLSAHALDLKTSLALAQAVGIAPRHIGILALCVPDAHAAHPGQAVVQALSQELMAIIAAATTPATL